MLPLDPIVRKFTWANVRACAERCAGAYAAETGCTGLGPGHIVTNARTDTLALVMDEGTCLSVAFRGSRNLRDWIQDFKALRKHPRVGLTWSYKYEVEGEVHEGFLENVESVVEDLIHTIAGLIQPRLVDKSVVPIFVTGHSKGAAECTLFALELVRQGFNVAGVYPIESPRLFNAAGARLYNAATMTNGLSLRDITFRIVNQNDIVPRVPLWTMGYRHCGQLVFLETWQGWSLNPGLWYQLASDVLGLYGAWRHKGDVLLADHSLANVQQRIQMIT